MKTSALRVGFVALNDCAPLVMARELGLYEQYGLRVILRRESSWERIRDKIIHGELDAAHAPGAIPFATSAGLDCEPCPCVAGLVLNLQGNAITLSSGLWEHGVRDASTMREEIHRSWGRMTYTFGVVFPYSSQHFLLRQWLKSAGINPDTDVCTVVIPPQQMFPNLKLGYLDGYCVGEPWTSVAVQAGAGFCAATSVELAPLHPEKVLMVRRDFADERAEEHERLIAALLEACAFCDHPEHRRHLSECLAQPQYVNAPADCVRAGLVGPFDYGRAGREPVPDLNIFHRHRANEPTDERAAWIMERITDVLQNSTLARSPMLKNVFRRDVFERAKQVLLEQAQRLNVDIKPGCESCDDKKLARLRVRR
ncbi:MAG: ABC transporter substrate-binding protein [Verrucomicrobia bacterium]|nr:ABC transporter substrate-binding protein [Verrucomicrobiota bacterium]